MGTAATMHGLATAEGGGSCPAAQPLVRRGVPAGGFAPFQRPLRHLASASLWALAKQKASPDEAHRLEAEEEACSRAGAGCSKFGGLTRHFPVALGTEHWALSTGH